MTEKEIRMVQKAEWLDNKMAALHTPSYIIDYLTNNYTSETAKNNVFNLLKSFMEWLMDQKLVVTNAWYNITLEDLEKIESVQFTRYFEQMRRSALKNSTINNRIKVIRSFFNYLFKNNKISTNYISAMSKKKFAVNNRKVKAVKLPSVEAVNNLLQSIITNAKNEYVALRNETIVMLFINTGIRCSELVNLNEDDVVLDVQRPFIRVLGKGKYTEEEYDTVYLNNIIAARLKEWLELQQYYKTMTVDEDAKRALFLEQSKKARIKEVSVAYFLRKYSDEKITPHMLRHFYGSQLYQKTHDIAFVQRQMRHSDINITMSYYVTSDAEVEDKAGVMDINMLE